MPKKYLKVVNNGHKTKKDELREKMFQAKSPKCELDALVGVIESMGLISKALSVNFLGYNGDKEEGGCVAEKIIDRLKERLYNKEFTSSLDMNIRLILELTHHFFPGRLGSEIIFAKSFYSSYKCVDIPNPVIGKIKSFEKRQKNSTYNKKERGHKKEIRKKRRFSNKVIRKTAKSYNS